tara:strand:+ start:7567 stop:10326 length:2760 start_codon:yes stop_codon:yes gene_type:complete
MATKVRLKKSAVAGRIPEVASLDYGELAINYQDGNLYYKNTDDDIKSLQESPVEFSAKNVSGGSVTKGQVVYINGVSGNKPTIALADADNPGAMPAFGLLKANADNNASVSIVTSGNLTGLDTSSFSVGDTLYVSTTPGEITNVKPSGESSLIQNIGKVVRAHASAGIIKVGGAGRTAATPNLNSGNIFIGNDSNYSITSSMETEVRKHLVAGHGIAYNTSTGVITRNAIDTDSVAEGSTNLYYTRSRFDSNVQNISTSIIPDTDSAYSLGSNSLRFKDLYLSGNSIFLGTMILHESNGQLAIRDSDDNPMTFELGHNSTDDLPEGSTNLYYTTARSDSDFDIRLDTKNTDDITEGTNLYYTTSRADSAIDVRVDSAFVDNLTTVLTNKILVDPLLDSTAVYGRQYGSLAINSNTNIGDSTQSVFNFSSDDSSRNSVLALSIDNQFSHGIGVSGTTASNEMVVGFSGTNTSFKVKSDIGSSPFDLDGGTTLLSIDTSGKINIPNFTEAASKTSAALTVAGGLGVDKNIRAQDIIAQGNVTATGTLFGTLSAASLSARSTSDLSEGTNLYYTDARVDSYVNTSINTTDIQEGTRLYYTTARADSDAKNAISVVDNGGDGSLSYNSSTGEVSYTGPSASDVRAHFTGGTGVTINSGSIAIGQTIATSDSVEFAGMTITGDLTVGGAYILNEQNDLRVTNALIKVADSNSSDAVDIGVVGRYSQDGGSTIRRAGFFRDATNGEWYAFNNLIQDDLDSSPSASTINRAAASFELGTWNFNALRGSYLGFDSDFRVFSTDYTSYSSDFTAVSAGRYAIDTTTASFTVTLPASPTTGDYIKLIDVGNWTDNSLFIARNGSTIEGYAENFELDLGQSILELIFINSTWQIFTSIGQRGPQGPKGDSADEADFSTRSQSIAFAVALG